MKSKAGSSERDVDIQCPGDFVLALARPDVRAVPVEKQWKGWDRRYFMEDGEGVFA